MIVHKNYILLYIVTGKTFSIDSNIIYCVTAIAHRRPDGHCIRIQYAIDLKPDIGTYNSCC